MRAVTTKIQPLLCEKIYLKPQRECVILFTIYDLFTMNVIWWGLEKNLEIYKNEYENQEKNSLFGCPPIPPLTKWRLTVFQCPETLKTSRAYPKWESDPNLVGQKRQGWAWYGQLLADSMNFIHVKFQDLQKKRAGVRFEVQK